MTGIRSTFVLMAMLGAGATTLSLGAVSPAQAGEQSGNDVSLRQRAEDLARAASERFSEILSGGKSQRVVQGTPPDAGKDTGATRGLRADARLGLAGVGVRGLRRRHCREIQKSIRRGGDYRASGRRRAATAGRARVARRGTATAPVASSEEPPQLEPSLGWTSLTENVREWLARANRSYRTEIVKKLIGAPQTATLRGDGASAEGRGRDAARNAAAGSARRGSRARHQIQSRRHRQGCGSGTQGQSDKAEAQARQGRSQRPRRSARPRQRPSASARQRPRRSARPKQRTSAGGSGRSETQGRSRGQAAGRGSRGQTQGRSRSQAHRASGRSQAQGRGGSRAARAGGRGKAQRGCGSQAACGGGRGEAQSRGGSQADCPRGRGEAQGRRRRGNQASAEELAAERKAVAEATRMAQASTDSSAQARLRPRCKSAPRARRRPRRPPRRRRSRRWRRGSSSVLRWRQRQQAGCQAPPQDGMRRARTGAAPSTDIVMSGARRAGTCTKAGAIVSVARSMDTAAVRRLGRGTRMWCAAATRCRGSRGATMGTARAIGGSIGRTGTGYETRTLFIRTSASIFRSAAVDCSGAGRGAGARLASSDQSKPHAPPRGSAAWCGPPRKS